MSKLLNTFYWALYKHYKKDHIETDFIARYYSASVIGMAINFLVSSILIFIVYSLFLHSLLYINIFDNRYIFTGIFSLNGILFTYCIYSKYKKSDPPSCSQIKFSHYLVFLFFFASMIIMVCSVIFSANILIKLK